MAIKSYRWHSPVCPCIFLETHDDALPDDPSVWNGMPEVKCSIHASVPDNEVYNVVLRKENQVQQFARGILLEVDDLVDLDDDGNPHFKYGAEMVTTFIGEGADRQLSVRVENRVLEEKLGRYQQQLADRQARGVSGSKNAVLADKISAAQAQKGEIAAALTANRGKVNVEFEKRFGKDKVTIEI